MTNIFLAQLNFHLYKQPALPLLSESIIALILIDRQPGKYLTLQRQFDLYEAMHEGCPNECNFLCTHICVLIYFYIKMIEKQINGTDKVSSRFDEN